MVEGSMYLLYRAASEALSSRTHQVLPGFRIRLQEHCFLAAGVQKRVLRFQTRSWGGSAKEQELCTRSHVHVRRRGTGCTCIDRSRIVASRDPRTAGRAKTAVPPILRWG